MFSKCHECGAQVLVANVMPLAGNGAKREPIYLRSDKVYVVKLDQRHPEAASGLLTGKVVTGYIPHTCQQPKKTKLVYKGAEEASPSGGGGY